MKHIPHPTSTKGITLIALVITIIVMLILVAVTITVAINGGLFTYAGKATGDTKNAIKDEQELANGRINIDGVWYDSMQDYIDEKPSTNQSGGTEENTMLLYNETVKDAQGLLTANATYESDGYTAVVPKGFKVSEVEGEQSISTGLVIKDVNNNEFVWIPVTEDLESSYSSGKMHNEPKELTFDNSIGSGVAIDSQTTLDELYGVNYYNYAEYFNYAKEYIEMVEKVNANNGFYIGRYETTIDEKGNVGSKYNTTVLTAGTTLFIKDGTSYPYRWYGLYQALKNVIVTGNGENVQTAMIYGVLWDKAMNFIRTQKVAEKTTYDVDTATSAWHQGSSIVKSGQANLGETGDVALNIWDLESNAYECTQEAFASLNRVVRGGNYNDSYTASNRHNNAPENDRTDYSSRVVLYIK